MIKIYILFFIFFIKPIFLNAIEFECQFEEVYTDGSIQNGFLLIKGQNMRYQYFDKNLFTIFKKKNDFFLVNNKDTEKFQKIPENQDLILDTIAIIANDYPDIKENYKNNSIEVKIEKNSQNFFKRLSIISKNLSMSIYLNNCENKKIENRFFYYFPYFEYS